MVYDELFETIANRNDTIDRDLWLELLQTSSNYYPEEGDIAPEPTLDWTPTYRAAEDPRRQVASLQDNVKEDVGAPMMDLGPPDAVPEGGELQKVNNQPDQHQQLENNNDNQQNTNNNNNNNDHENDNEIPLLLEPDESDAPGADEEPSAEDGPAPDGPVRFRRKIGEVDAPGDEEADGGSSAPDGTERPTREIDGSDAPGDEETARGSSAHDGTVRFTRDIPRRSERLKNKDMVRPQPVQATRNKPGTLPNDEYLRTKPGHFSASCWTTEMKYRRRLDTPEDASLLYGLDLGSEAINYTGRLYSYLKGISVHPKADTVGCMHPLALYIQSRNIDCPTWNEVKHESSNIKHEASSMKHEA